MYRQKSYWPLLKFAAGLSGIVSISFISLAISALAQYEKTGSHGWELILLLLAIAGISGAGCIGIFLKRWWGRGIMTFVAALYLIAFPIGTLLGIFILRGLSKHKNEFR
ncbi:MAG: hypothetical protein ACSHX9_01495 [Luteolibacter sp.]